MNIKDTNIKGNIAQQNGGGVFFYCDAIRTKNCSLVMNSNTTVAFNKAYLYGGGIFWNYYEPDNGVIINNTAYVYGNDYAAVGFKIVSYSASGEYDTDKKSINFTDVVSGGSIKGILLALVDKNGEIMKADNSSRISFSTLSLDP